MLPDAVIQGMGWGPQAPAGPFEPPAPPWGGALPPVAPPPSPPSPLQTPPPPLPPVDSALSGFQPPGPGIGPLSPQSPDSAPTVGAPPQAPATAPPPASAAPLRGGKPAKPPAPKSIATQQAEADQAQAEAEAAGYQAIGQTAAAKIAEGNAVFAAQRENDAKIKDIETKRQAEAESNAKIHAQKQLYADNAHKELDDYKVDHSKLWNDMGAGRQFGMYLAMALSGLGQALSGKGNEPNPVLQMMQAKNRELVQAQMDQREELAKKYGRAKEDVGAHDAFAKDRDANLLLQESLFDKQLARDLNLAAAKSNDANVRANAATEAAKLEQSSADKKAQAVERAAQRDIQNKQIAISQGQLGVAQGHLRLGIDEFQHQKDKDQQELDLKAAALLQKGDKRGSEEYQKFGLPGVSVKSEDGKTSEPFIATGSPEGVEKLREKIGASRTIIQLLSEAKRIRTGYSNNNLASREEWQRLKQIWATAKAKGKDTLGLGALSESDYEVLDGYLGADDPTTWRDPTAGIDQARRTVMQDLNNAISVHNRSGKPFEIDDLVISDPKAPVVSDEDKAVKEALAEPLSNPETRRQIAGVHQIPGINVPWGSKVAPWAAGEDRAVRETFRQTGMSSSVKQNLDTWGAALASDDTATRDKAAKILGQLANTAETDAVKEYASQLLMNNMGAKSTGELDAVTRQREGTAKRQGAKVTP